MTAINATPFATVHIGVAQDAPPSPTLTNPDMILPYSGSSRAPASLTPLRTLQTSESEPTVSASQAYPGHNLRPVQDNHAEIGVATAVMPMRFKAGPPVAVLSSYAGYEHGAPLSDIGEEEMTPRSRKSRKSRSPSPVEPLSPTPQSKTLRHKKRLSDHSSSGGSDVGDWENFDTSKMMSGRLAADVAREDEEDDGPESKRNSVITVSNEDRDEMAILNAKAEKILENARKRLTHMEDNLTKARHSVYLGDRVLANMRSSPNLSDLHQPAGGLYRSISLASRRSKPLFPVTKSPSVHTRGSSDTTTSTGLKRLSMIPETRSSSAQEYGRQANSPQFTPQSRASPSLRVVGHSPASSRSINSPMRTLEEEQESPSTVRTSPENAMTHGLGIDTFTNSNKEVEDYRPSTSLPPVRSASAASTRSIRDQVTDLRMRISDLQTKTKADRQRRQNSLSRNTPSPFSHAADPEQWYTSAPEYKEGGSPYSARAGVGWSPTHSKKPSLDAKMAPITPQPVKIVDGELPSTTQSSRFDTRTDMNTPNLHKRDLMPAPEVDRADSVIQESFYEDAPQDFEDEDQIAASEEEQIYLNEMLEESLQDVEPEVPDIPEHLLPTDAEAERHEDRLDAFDYENMFLHSAMGNFASRSRSGSDISDSSSAATKRANQATPTADQMDDEDYDEDEAQNDDTVVIGHDSQTTSAKEPFHEDSVLTPTKLVPPQQPWLKHPQRSQSVESVSTVATFATATEGGRDEDDDEAIPSEILTWGNGVAFPKPPLTSPKRGVAGAWPTAATNRQMPQTTRVVSPAKSPQLAIMTGNAFNNGMPTPKQSPMISALTSTDPGQQDFQPTAPRPDHPANTEILMESLIKLADPDFTVHGTGNTFADIDKDLVLSLLRSVGGVCNGVLKAAKRGEVRDVKALRRRLDLARRLLEGEEGED